ncbi:MAG: CAP domain-containing protein [Syntrophomonas sp.]|nr:CAP domain-containing protein [Syntrophomonas sp.]
MKKKILVTSIIMLLSMMTLIQVEPAGSAGGQAAVTTLHNDDTTRLSQAGADLAQPVGENESTLQSKGKISSPCPTPAPAAPAVEIFPNSLPDVQVQTQAATSPPKTKQAAPVKPTPKTRVPVVTAPAPTQASAQQQEMLGYINAARAQANLAPLVLDNRLCDGAYLKSQDMAVNGYFSHTSPTYGSPFEMMKSFGISYRTAAENIARNSSVVAAHNAFMNSNGHRANILNPAFTKIGLGFYQKGSDLFVTQWFTN